MVSGVALPVPLRILSSQVLHAAVDKVLVDVKQPTAGSHVLVLQRPLVSQLGRHMEVVGVHDLVTGRLLRVRSQSVVFQPVAGQPRNVLHRQVHDGVLGHRRMAVPQDPPLMEVRRFLLTHLSRNLVERLRPSGGHGERHGNLLLRQQTRVQGINTPGIETKLFGIHTG